MLPGDDPKNPNYVGFTNWAVGNLYNAYVVGKSASDNAISYLFEEQNAKAIVSPLIGLKPDISSFTTELTQIRAIVNEYHKTLLSGALGDDWEEKYEEFLAKLKAAGVDKVNEELQKQVDEFIKSKGLDKNNIIAQ